MKKRIAIVIAGIIVVVLGKGFFFYSGFYSPPPSEMPNYEHIAVLSPPLTGFSGNVSQEEGTVLFDLAHDNNFDVEELNVLMTQLISRGLTVKFLGVEDNLEEKLRSADAFGVISPVASYSRDEVMLVRKFVDKGGKLLLIADPTRPGKVSNLSTEFGLVFESGYLYNLKENEGNFRNVFISQFGTNELTKNLTKIVFYTAGYISPATNGIAFTDDNTLSSVMEVKGRLSPIALSSNSKVLAISDLTFMTEPHNAVYDNNQFISNTADWLAESERIFLLSDFPHFISDDLAITYTDPSLLDMATRLKLLLSDMGKEAEISQYEDALTLSKDTIFLGLFKEIEAVEGYLETANISITTEEKEEEEEKEKAVPIPEAENEEPEAKDELEAEEELEKLLITIEIGGMGEVYKEGTSLIYLSGEPSKRLLLILADTEDMLRETVDLLEEGDFRQWLISDQLAICRTEKGIDLTEAFKNEK